MLIDLHLRIFILHGDNINLTIEFVHDVIIVTNNTYLISKVWSE